MENFQILLAKEDGDVKNSFVTSVSQELREALYREGPELWAELTKRLMAYTIVQLRGRRWRCVYNGVPPDGFDAESIVRQAVEELLVGSGWEPKGSTYTKQELEYELRRLAMNVIRRLERRKENRITTSEPDLAHNDGEISDEPFFNNVAGNFPTPDSELDRKEAELLLRQFQVDFITFLGTEKLPRQIFECICDGITKRDDQAKRIGVSVQEITNARKRLNRRLDNFAEEHSKYANQFINEIKNA